MSMRVRFIKPCAAAGRSYRPGDEDDFDVDLSNEIVALGAGEIIGESEPLSSVTAPPGFIDRIVRAVRTLLP